MKSMADERGRTSECAVVEHGCQESLTFKVPDHVRTAHGPDGGTVLDIHLGEMFRLNLTASRILELLKQGLGEPAVAKQLALEFGIEHQRANEDVHEFVETLAKHHLVTSDNRTTLA